MAATLIREDKMGGDSYDASSRFSQIIKHTGLKYGHKDLDMQLWTADGTNGTTYTAATGTDGQQQHPTHAFADDSDDSCFIRFMVPPDYKPGGDFFLLVWFYSADHTATHKTAFDVKVRTVPTTSSIAASTDHASNVVLDGTGTAVAADFAAYVDDTVSEIKSLQLDLTNSGAATYDPFDLLLVEVENDSSESTISDDVTFVHAALIWER